MYANMFASSKKSSKKDKGKKITEKTREEQTSRFVNKASNLNTEDVEARIQSYSYEVSHTSKDI